MAKFRLGNDGIERCTKRVTVELTRAQNDFCMNVVGRVPLRKDDGGGKDVDTYLAQVLKKALEQEIEQFSQP